MELLHELLHVTIATADRINTEKMMITKAQTTSQVKKAEDNKPWQLPQRSAHARAIHYRLSPFQNPSPSQGAPQTEAQTTSRMG
mmetsp:Transcript_25252/g.39936  ORF Transcript_25252/g.39936 Transcript_25252/m.39936 type:complete len:84 (+) Transcript_25252:166-417(+)